MDKQQILDEIKRTAKDNGGIPLGRLKFCTETGIGENAWLRYWARWSEAVSEAGFEPNQRTQSYGESALLERVSGFIRELRRFPVVRDLRLRALRGDGFPAETTIRRLGNKAELAAKLLAHLKGRDGFADIVEICEPLARPGSIGRPTKSDAQAANGFVYLIQSGKRYKVGATSDLAVRTNAIGVQTPDPSKTVHFIRTDDPFGIEAYWHKRFAAKRTNGEWFELTREDVSAFKRRKTM